MTTSWICSRCDWNTMNMCRYCYGLLDPEKIEGKKINAAFFKPSKSTYFNSDKVVEIEHLLLKVLKKSEVVKNQLVTHVCAAEKCSFAIIQKLMTLPLEHLARVLISGVVPDEDLFVFPPIPNFIFTRDIAITVNDHLLLTKPSEKSKGTRSHFDEIHGFLYFVWRRRWQVFR